MSDSPTASSGIRGWYLRARLPLLTVGVFAVLAVLLWSNAIINRYRFNVVIAVIGSVPLTVLLIRAATTARHAQRATGPNEAG